MKNLFVSLVSVCLFGGSCSKKDNVPDANSEHFYCWIDDHYYQPEHSGSSGFKSFKKVYIQFTNNKSLLVVGSAVSFVIRDENGIQFNKVYHLGAKDPYSNSGSYDIVPQSKVYTTDQFNTGTVTLRSGKAGYIAGQFEFHAKDSTTNETVQITNGSFNLAY